MTQKDYNEIYKFLGKESHCFAILRKIIGSETFNEIKSSTKGKYFDKVNGDISQTGNVYFIKRAKTAKVNCLLFHTQDLPISQTQKGVFLLTRIYIEGRNAILQQHIDKMANKKNDKQKSHTINRLKDMSYNEFLRTDYWKHVRQEKLRQCGHKCQLCGSTNKLHIHHNSYKHHGDEANHLEDLVVLCEQCHNTFHKHRKIDK